MSSEEQTITDINFLKELNNNKINIDLETKINLEQLDEQESEFTLLEESSKDDHQKIHEDDETDEWLKRIEMTAAENELWQQLSPIGIKYSRMIIGTNKDILQAIIADANAGKITISSDILDHMEKYQQSLHPADDISEHFEFGKHLENVILGYIYKKYK